MSALLAALKESNADAWSRYTEHEFVQRLGAGTLPRAAFLHYLRQDYIFLVHFSRAWGLALVKSESLAEMKHCAATVDALVNTEMRLHVETCAAEGIDEASLFATVEAPENLAYTRFVMDAGLSGDLLDLLTALAPCLFGYGEIGARLAESASLDGHPYRAWIETYSGAEYQALCRGKHAALRCRRRRANRHGCNRFAPMGTTEPDICARLRTRSRILVHGPARGRVGRAMTTDARIEGRFDLDGRVLVSPFSLSLDPGCWTCLLGASGSGKTTLLRELAGLETGAAFAGTVERPSGGVGLMAQSALLAPWLTALANVSFGDRLRGTRPDTSRAARLLAQVGLGEDGAKRPAQLSGGMRQRVALARTLYENRDVVLMDEPFSALDAVTREAMQSLAFRLLAGRTVLLVTHDPLEALRLGARIFVLRDGDLNEAQVPASPPLRETDTPEMIATHRNLFAMLRESSA